MGAHDHRTLRDGHITEADGDRLVPSPIGVLAIADEVERIDIGIDVPVVALLTVRVEGITRCKADGARYTIIVAAAHAAVIDHRPSPWDPIAIDRDTDALAVRAPCVGAGLRVAIIAGRTGQGRSRRGSLTINGHTHTLAGSAPYITRRQGIAIVAAAARKCRTSGRALAIKWLTGTDALGGPDIIAGSRVVVIAGTAHGSRTTRHPKAILHHAGAVAVALDHIIDGVRIPVIARSSGFTVPTSTLAGRGLQGVARTAILRIAYAVAIGIG
jgi:hypothetical protein